MNKSGTEAYQRYRSSEKYKRTFMTGHLMRTYGLSLEQYNVMLAAQQGVCKICCKPDDRTWKKGRQYAPLCVDHDHATGRVRGLLCNKCNVAIALLKDSIENLRRAMTYLEGN
jgi:hypothetical protein